MSGAPTILLVDDDPDIREVVATLLDFHGWRVEEAGDGLEALALIRVIGPPALILLDLMLPHLSGEDFVRALRQEPQGRAIPVVVLSGDGSARAMAREMDVQGCMVKPVGMEELLAAAERYAPLAPVGHAPGPG